MGVDRCVWRAGQLRWWPQGRRGGSFPAAVVSMLVGIAAAATSTAQSLEKSIQGALYQARLGTAHVGVSVYDIDRNSEIVSINVGGKSGDSGYIPASNLKLLTSGAALAVLGKDYEFKTTLLKDGDRLIVRGSGDPGFADPELLEKMGTSLNTLLDKWVEMAKGSMGAGGGIREIVLDDRVFDREYVHPEWPREQLHLAYCAQVSGLNFHANVLNVYVEPARSQPEAPWIVVKRATRRVKQGSTELRLDREKDSPYTFKLSGTVRNNPDGPVQVTVNESCMMLGRLLADRVVAAGMAAANLPKSGPDEPPLPVRMAAPDEQVSANAAVLAVVKTPIAVVLERCNVDSDNLYAESLLKATGHKATGQAGSWTNGAAVVRMQLQERLGPSFATQLVMTDGSGLSRGNRVTPGMLTRWMSSLARDPQLGPVFVQSLAEIGEGTLRKRFKGSKLNCEIRGKSGYIRQVRTLSGIVTEPRTGRRMAYSVLVNDVPPDADAKSKEFHESVVELIDKHLTAEAARAAPKMAEQPGSEKEKVGG